MCTVRKARIAYTGSAVENGTMPVKDLAPALLSFAELVEEAYKTIGGRQELKVLLNQDSLNKGSFDITFLFNLDFLNQVKLFVSGVKEIGLDDLLTVFGWGVTLKETGSGVFWLIKTIKNRRIKKIDDTQKPKITITLNDGTKIETNENTLKVFLNVDCRNHIEQVMKPLKEEGVDGFELRNPEKQADKNPLVRVDKEQAELFKAPPAAEPSEEPVVSSQTRLVSIVSINFQNGKWRFSDGSAVFWASMEDEDFNQKVAKAELAFSNGDMLRVVLESTQAVKDGKLTSEYAVKKVIEQIRAPKQIKLDFDGTSDKEKE